MEWTHLMASATLHEEGRIADRAGRSEFERDADRIIFSSSFRRLAKKTQVHPLATNDHVHNRLTHSIETGRIGRTLGKAVGDWLESKRYLPETVSAGDLAAVVQAACLAHDIGNPPLGHAGERAISDWFSSADGRHHLETLSADEAKDLASFDGNAQGFRILTTTENRLYDGGLRLTPATLAAFLKYPQTALRPTSTGKFSVFWSERDVLNDVAERVGLLEADGVFARHPLAYLVEAADDICYSILDVEDAVELRLLTFEEASETLLEQLEPETSRLVRADLQSPEHFRSNLARIRGPLFQALIDGAVQAFANAYVEIMEGRTGVGPLCARIPGTMGRTVERLKKIGTDRIYTDAKKVEVELAFYPVADTLLKTLFEAADELLRSDHHDPKRLSSRTRLVFTLWGDTAPSAVAMPGGTTWTHYSAYRRALDFISGMTDNYALYVHRTMQGHVAFPHA